MLANLRKTARRACSRGWIAALAAAVLVCMQTGPAAAARVRFHYAPTDACGTVALKPSGPGGCAGESVSWFGMVREPCALQLRPTVVATLRNPYTGALVRVPLALPEGTPRIEHVRDRVVYNYGSYAVEVQFYPDGSVDVIYNSGFLRGL